MYLVDSKAVEIKVLRVAFFLVDQLVISIVTQVVIVIVAALFRLRVVNVGLILHARHCWLSLHLQSNLTSHYSTSVVCGTSHVLCCLRQRVTQPFG